VHSKVHRIPHPLLFQWFLCTLQAKKRCPACIGFAGMRRKVEGALCHDAAL
jgi:hypothetical protein